MSLDAQLYYGLRLKRATDACFLFVFGAAEKSVSESCSCTSCAGRVAIVQERTKDYETKPRVSTFTTERSAIGGAA